uniref:protein-tyrosine-phosphatase n=1 Tax=Sexangularia sp. CB-2014 TaxID=1486929 RepID=A0A7S1V8J9_9EUKA|mmetsp:Transcript_13884/g.43707  ORF Transcript_13884/g.43707 Transcript_13884/m.43707 type:complete len:373 (+) Transcript_13884:70-1188(+)
MKSPPDSSSRVDDVSIAVQTPECCGSGSVECGTRKERSASASDVLLVRSSFGHLSPKCSTSTSSRREESSSPDVCTEVDTAPSTVPSPVASPVASRREATPLADLEHLRFRQRPNPLQPDFDWADALGWSEFGPEAANTAQASRDGDTVSDAFLLHFLASLLAWKDPFVQSSADDDRILDIVSTRLRIESVRHEPTASKVVFMWNVLRERRATESTAAAILPGRLFLGCAWNASSARYLKELGVTHILNVAAECECPFPSSFTYLHLPMADESEQVLGSAIDEAVDYLETVLATPADGETPNVVFVHCNQGVSRAPTFVTAFLMRAHSVAGADALQRIRQVRPIVRPNTGFLQQLRDLEVCLTGSTTLPDTL